MAKLPLKSSILTAALLLIAGHEVHAKAFPLPNTGDSLIGTPDKLIYTKAHKEETLLEVARRYDLGQNQIIKANKDVDRWMPSKPEEKLTIDKEGNQFMALGEGKDIHIPNSYLLPSTKYSGIVLNLPEYRLYYYRRGSVITHPISIGRVDWNTPLGLTKIIAKVRNPTWTPPASIRREHAEQGEILPAVFPAGPDNPLGLFAMRLGRAGYLIHSTNKPLGVGMRVSHGCVRMYPEDIERIFPSVSVGTPVRIVNEPIKVGWSNGSLYIEVHPDLEDKQRSLSQRQDIALNLIERAKGNELINISGEKLMQALTESNGIPVAIYKGAAPINNPATVVRLPVPEDSTSPYINESNSLMPKPAAPLLNTPQEIDLLPVNPDINPAPANPAILPDTISPPPVLDENYNAPPILYDNQNYNIQSVTPLPSTTSNVKNLPPMPRLEDTVNINPPNNYTIVQEAEPTPPVLEITPLPPEPEYSILKSAVPPN